MSNVVSALGNMSSRGFAVVSEIGPVGMISLRAKPDTAGLADAVRSVVGTNLPNIRQIEVSGACAAGWMSPDEYLLIMPYDATAAALDVIAKAMAGQHHLAAVVSDARAVFTVEGAQASQVLAKLSPVDFHHLGPNELRRTRAAQVACAMWREGDGYKVVCFRSVATYVFGLLTHSALPGSEI
jgi:sarcosine oxidase subunit gamma